MNPLRQRMLEDMRIRNFSETTQETYLRQVAYFARHYRKSPEHLGLPEIRDYQVYLAEYKGASVSVRAQAVSALRFFYKVTLGKDWNIEKIPYPKQPKRLPVVLSREEVATFLGSIRNLKHRAMLTTVYAAGLRASEVLRLRVEDIDSQRMTLRIYQGKGRQDRYVMLSAQLLALLREYWKAYRPEPWLFLGQTGDRPLRGASLRYVCRRIHRLGADQERNAPHAAAQLRNPSARKRRRPAHDPDAARSPERLLDEPLYPRVPGPAARDPEPSRRTA